MSSKNASSHLIVGCHANRVVAPIESHELGLEENVTIDLKIRSGTLDCPEAGCSKLVSFRALKHSEMWKEGLLVPAASAVAKLTR